MTSRNTSGPGKVKPGGSGAPRRRGRPSRTVVDRLVTQAWYSEVRRRLGYLSNRKIERRFEPATVRKNPVSGEWTRPCKFDKYHRGEHSPSPQVVSAVEKELPGSSAVFENQIWRVIDRPSPSLAELQTLMASFSGRLKAILFEVIRPPGSVQPTYKRRRLGQDDYPEIRKQGDLEALTCLFALAREAEWTKNQAQHRHAAGWAMRLLFALWIYPPLSGIRQQFWLYLKDEFFGRTYNRLMPLGANLIDAEYMAQLFEEILLRMEDAGVLDSYDFDQQSRLFWHADLGNIALFLSDARFLTGVKECSRGVDEEALFSKYYELVRAQIY